MGVLVNIQSTKFFTCIATIHDKTILYFNNNVTIPEWK